MSLNFRALPKLLRLYRRTLFGTAQNYIMQRTDIIIMLTFSWYTSTDTVVVECEVLTLSIVRKINKYWS